MCDERRVDGVTATGGHPTSDVVGPECHQVDVGGIAGAGELGEAVPHCRRGFDSSGAPHSDGEEDAESLELRREKRQQRQGGIVGPLKVVDDDHRRLVACTELVHDGELGRQQSAGGFLFARPTVGLEVVARQQRPDSVSP